MRKKYEQSLAVCQLELNGLSSHYGFDKSKQIDDEDEFIDVTGDYPSEPESIDRFKPRNLTYLEQPPSKIYYDNIEKESSDGGFFDRDDLEDEDERNDLVIDCKLTGEGGEKKTESRIINDTRGKPSPLAEPEIVFNFTLVDTKLVYNAPALDRQQPTHESMQTVSVRGRPVIPSLPTLPPSPNSRPPQQQQASPMASLKNVRFHPFPRISGTLPSSPRKVAAYRSAEAHVKPVGNSFPSAVPSIEPIGSRLRPSAFSPPLKSQFTPQSVPLRSTVGSTQPAYHKRPYPIQSSPGKSPKKHYRQSAMVPQQFPYPPFGRYAKLIRNWSKQQHGDRPPPPPLLEESRRPRAPSYLPPQFGFGSTALHNLYDSLQPLDYSKNSLLSQYEAMLKQPVHQQVRYGNSILRSMPIPTPPSPPPHAFRPKTIPVKQHPTISKIHQLARPNEALSPKPSTPPQQPLPTPVVSEKFRANVRQEIDAFFNRRQNEICAALRLFSDENIDQPELFRRLEHYQIRFSRDYLELAWNMLQRYGYSFRTPVPPSKLEYRWPERPQDFVEYFKKVRSDLRPHASLEKLNIYRMVVGGLLEQFRASIESFLSTNLQ